MKTMALLMRRRTVLTMWRTSPFFHMRADAPSTLVRPVHRVVRLLAHSRHAGRSRYLRPRHDRGRGRRKRRTRG